MANAVRATTMANRDRSPSRRSSQMMNSGQGPSIFASIATEDDEENGCRIANAEVQNITNYYSPINDDSLSMESPPMNIGRKQSSPVPMTQEVPRALFVPNPNDPVEENLRRKCAFYFMDPVQKFIARRQAPWKLILQFAKIILITAQLLIFGQFRYAHTNYYKDNQITFEHLFLKNWDAAREINAYPPATGKYAIYKKQTFFDLFDYTATTFNAIEDLTVSPTIKNSSLEFCVQTYKPLSTNRDLFGEDIIGHQDDLEKACIKIHDLNDFNSTDYLSKNNFTIKWNLLVDMKISFAINTITSKRLGPTRGPECFNFVIDIKFDNSNHDGQLVIVMTSTPKHFTCSQPVYSDESEVFSIRILSVVVGVICITSLVLCCRALIRGQLLANETKAFFQDRYKIRLSLTEMIQFLNFWYVIICINDILIIIGSVLKEIIENKRSNTDLWDMCSACLGIGNLLVWMGMLRYLGFFEKYNVIILTIQQAVPNIIRFTLCVSIMYFGFVFCGWVVLGPYQLKFATLSSTSECLFSLINGDDMFATFSMVSNHGGMIWGFSRVYLYIFVIIFIYVVLSLFIAIIMDAYEVVKEHYKVGFPKSRVDTFCRAIDYDIYSKTFCQGFSPSFVYNIWAWYKIKKYGSQWQGYEREQLSDEDTNNDQSPLIT